MTNEQIEELRKKWEQNGGKTVEISDNENGFSFKEFVESLSYTPSKPDASWDDES